jgi:high-affinity Fe2+/Pb2+ permease
MQPSYEASHREFRAWGLGSFFISTCCIWLVAAAGVAVMGMQHVSRAHAHIPAVFGESLTWQLA